MIEKMMISIMIKHGDLHNDQTYFDIKIYRWEHIEVKLKLKLSNMCMLYHTPSSLRGLYLD